MTLKKHIWAFLFVLMTVYLVREIINFNSMYEKAWTAPDYAVSGPENATVTVIEFIDYNCPYCRELYPVVQDVMDKRKDIRFIARPIAPLGERSKKLLQLTLAAGKQGKFFELHGAFLKHKGQLSDVFVRAKAAELGLDVARLYRDAESPEVLKDLQSNTDAASVLGIRYTPSLMINRTIYVPEKGMPTSTELLKVIQEATQ